MSEKELTTGSEDGNKVDDGKDTSSPPVITEHKAKILTEKNVFYNPVQEFNRDLSVVVLNVYSKLVETETSTRPKVQGLRILEALSASGLRSIRYAQEVYGVKEIIANDLSRTAVESIKANVAYNKVEHLVTTNLGDAITYMYLSSKPENRFDCIDLDPYGSPSRYLDAALQAIKDGGLLLVTATDMAVLTGNSPQSCYVKYGAVPLKTSCCHEMALRILLKCIESIANRYGKYIEPLLSVSVDFYIRVFVRVFVGPANCNLSLTKQSMVYQCTGCRTMHLQPLGVLKKEVDKSKPMHIKYSLPLGPPVESKCEFCHHKYHMGGPIWSAPIHDKAFVSNLLQTIQKSFRSLGTFQRLLGILTVVDEELNDIPLYYCLEKLCSTLKLQTIPIILFRSILLNDDYRVSFSHAFRTSIKTNAPPRVIWDILRCWNKENPVSKNRMIEGTPIHSILSAESEKEYAINTNSYHPKANPRSREMSLRRYQMNPESHWGPGTRATTMVAKDKSNLYKRQRNQNKGKKARRTLKKSDDEEEEEEDDDNGRRCKQTKTETSAESLESQPNEKTPI